MHFNHYGGSGTFLAADLLNCADFTPAVLRDLLTSHEMASRNLTTAQSAALATWVEGARPLFGEPDVTRQVTLVNALLTAVTTSVRVSMHDGNAPHLHYITGTDDPVERISAAIAGGLAVAVCGAGGGRLGRCSRLDCPIVYVDTSRNGRRRFCSTACANRVNVAAHRARSLPRP
ncbi:CGNR zinc finger domain-containing protein [Dactylosporangium sp. CS-033363]|uniref:CGNR zinc finger domain-containing protein n=1 Tax=Dactylosporangium sp. CS-033363 TaxID=3239935 RepID=UPI003D8F5F05